MLTLGLQGWATAFSPKVAGCSRPGSRMMYRDDADHVKNDSVSAMDLRRIEVEDIRGQLISLGEAIGDGPTVVIFLRHLGCSWCWSYVYQWNALSQEVEASGLDGPIFVSIGDPERLKTFLEKHPEIPSSRFFVDGYNFEAYKKAGFGRFDEKDDKLTKDLRPKPIRLGGIGGWLKFLTNFMQLAPVTPEMSFPENLSPEGLFWVGGTIVLEGDNIVYRWDDRISGDHPEVLDVLSMATKGRNP